MQPDDAVGTDAGAKAGDQVVRSDERTLALVAHLIGAFAGCIGPIIIFAIKREDSKFVAFHAIQAFLWHVALVAAWIVSFVVFGVSMSAIAPHMPHTPPGSPGPPPPMPAFWGSAMGIVMMVLWLAMMGGWTVYLGAAIYVGVQAQAGKWTRYPVVGMIASRFVRPPASPT